MMWKLAPKPGPRGIKKIGARQARAQMQGSSERNKEKKLSSLLHEYAWYFMDFTLSATGWRQQKRNKQQTVTTKNDL